MKRLLLPALALLVASCTTTKNKGPERGTRPSEQAMQAALADTVNPREFGLTIYRSPEGPVFTDTNRVHPAQDDLLDFVDKKSLAPVVLWETPDGQKIPVVFDTRSPKTWVEILTAQSLGFRAVGPTPFSARPRHLTDDTEGYLALRSSLTFGAVRFESPLWHVRPQYKTLGPLGRGLKKPEPMVVFGLDMMKSFAYVRFDFTTLSVSFATDMPYKPNKLAVVANLPFKITPEGLSVEGIVDTYRGPVLLDTGGDYEVAMKLGETSSSRVRQVTLGDFARRNVGVNDAEFLGFGADPKPSVGFRLLDGLLVTLDFVNSRVYFEIPPPAEPVP